MNRGQPRQRGPSDIATKEGRAFVRLALSLGVGVAIGLAPFLGNLTVPGFTPLLAIFPRTLREGALIPFSAFLMGIIATMIQYYAELPTPSKSVHVIFRKSARLLIAAFVLLVVSYFAFVVQVPLPGKPSEAVVVGLIRLETCGCANDSARLQCVEDLSLFPGAIERCWGSLQVGLSKAYLSLLYLLVTGSFGAIIGLIVLRGTKSDPAKHKRVTRKAARPKKKPASKPDQKPPAEPFA